MLLSENLPQTSRFFTRIYPCHYATLDIRDVGSTADGVFKCHGYCGYIRVKNLEDWGKFSESNIRVFDVG